MNTWVLGSHNAGKCKELEAKLAELNVCIKPLSEYTKTSAEEPACTFVENAILKARYASEASGLPAIADDSGLCVPYLDGTPGVYSARYAGEPCNHDNNIDKLLSDMSAAQGNDRAAYFITVLVFVNHPNDPTPLIAEGRWHGEILTSRRGEQGFGYDPVFYIPNLDRSAAELSLDEKNKLSHRGQAVSKLKEMLSNS